MDKKINQKRGPTVGNAGTPEKYSAFVAAKKAWGATATAIAAAIGARAGNPKSMPISHEKGQGSISPNTNKGRGPTKGNK
jgi:hypothetical protein